MLVKGRTFKTKVFPSFHTPCFSAMHKGMSRCQKICINLLSLTHMYSTTFFHTPSYQHTCLLQTYKTQTDFLASEQTPNSIMKLQVEHLGFLQDLRFSVQYSSTVQLFTCPQKIFYLTSRCMPFISRFRYSEQSACLEKPGNLISYILPRKRQKIKLDWRARQ